MSPPSGMLAFEDVWKAFGSLPGGRRSVLRGVNWRLGAGETAVIRGANGSGKSTLLALAAGLVRPSRGHVAVLGHAAGDPRALARIGWHAERPSFRELSRLPAALVEHLEAFGWRRRDAVRRAAELLEAVGLAGEERTRVVECSAGMLQKLALARAVAHRPRLLLADEPFAALDLSSRTLVRWAIEGVIDDGGAAVIVSHLDTVVEGIEARVWLLADGGLKGEAAA